MVRVHFKDLDASQLAKDVLFERLHDAAVRFPELKQHRLVATLSMENSPLHRGPDVFGVKLNISGPKFKNIILEKKAANLYLAAAQMQESLLERLNRYADKKRVKSRTRQRKEFSKPQVEGAR